MVLVTSIVHLGFILHSMADFGGLPDVIHVLLFVEKRLSIGMRMRIKLEVFVVGQFKEFKKTWPIGFEVR